MKLYRDETAVPEGKRVLALGTFDGLHRAHRKIIDSAKSYARENGMEYGVFIFDKSPKEVMNQRKPEYLITFEEKLELLSDCDFIYVKRFDEAFWNLSCEAFIQFLKKRLGAAALFAGFNYRFGRGAAGDAAALKALAAAYGMKAFIISEQLHNGKRISSSAIRAYIRNGNVEGAAELLGRAFSVRGMVVKGFQNGRKMGFPTANVDYQNTCLIPKNGVYAGITVVDGREYKSVVNVGANPTFNARKITLETHILDFDQDIYDKIITVKFQKHIRDDQKFSSMEQLARQIQQDVRTAKEYLR